jgi:DNA-binding transcriptional ArsR family regulator
MERKIMKILSNDVLEMVAGQFKVLAEPVRLQILQCVGEEEKTVSEIVVLTKASQPNVSKHLKVMQEAGILVRRQEKNSAFFRAADPTIFKMCDIVCGSLKERSENKAKILALV